MLGLRGKDGMDDWWASYGFDLWCGGKWGGWELGELANNDVSLPR